MTEMRGAMYSLAGAIALVLVFALGADAAEHYPCGAEGVEAATLPPPGFHYRMYNFLANYDENLDAHGDKDDTDFDLDVFANVSRLVYITQKKILGAYYGMDLVIPFARTDLRVAIPPPGPGVVFEDDSFGLGDIVVEPVVLAWHQARFSASAGAGVVIPSGHFKDNPAKLYTGKGYWSGIFTLGGTFYFDEAKTTSVSILTRTLVHSEQRHTDIRPGPDFLFEWGLGKTIPAGRRLLVRPGVAGFAEWQVGDDHGENASGLRERRFGAGAELNFFLLPPVLLQVNLRVLADFGIRNGPRGIQGVLTLTKSF